MRVWGWLVSKLFPSRMADGSGCKFVASTDARRGLRLDGRDWNSGVRRDPGQSAARVSALDPSTRARARSEGPNPTRQRHRRLVGLRRYPVSGLKLSRRPRYNRPERRASRTHRLIFECVETSYAVYIHLFAWGHLSRCKLSRPWTAGVIWVSGMLSIKSPGHCS